MQVAQPWLPRSTGLNTFFSRRSDPDLYQVMWITLALFLSYLCVAMSLPVTSLYVSSQLDLGNALAGLAVGITFVSTILTRSLAGRLADHHGGKYALVRVCGSMGWRG
jgi:MFS family permease